MLARLGRLFKVGRDELLFLSFSLFFLFLSHSFFFCPRLRSNYRDKRGVLLEKGGKEGEKVLLLASLLNIGSASTKQRQQNSCEEEDFFSLADELGKITSGDTWLSFLLSLLSFFPLSFSSFFLSFFPLSSFLFLFLLSLDFCGEQMNERTERVKSCLLALPA